MNNGCAYGYFIVSCFIFLTCAAFLWYQTDGATPHCDIDSKAYLQRGELFHTTNQFKVTSHEKQPYYALGYAAIVGILFKFFGQSIAALIILNIVLALLSCLLMMRVARMLFNQRASFIVALLFSINSGYLVFSQFVLTEVVLSFFLLLFFERMTFFLQLKRITYLAQASLALGLSILVKPAAIFFIFPLCIVLIVVHHRTITLKLLHLCICIICFYIPVVGYMTYNYHAFGNFCVSRLDGVNLYYWFFPNVLAAEHGTTSDYERLGLLELSEGSHNFDVVRPLFLNKLKQKPLLFGYVWLKNVSKTFFGLYTTNLKVLVEPSVYGGDVSYFKQQGSIVHRGWAYIAAGVTKKWVTVVGVIEVIYSVGRYFFSVIGIIALCRMRKYNELLLCLLFITYFSLITGHDGCARFRMMFECIPLILAAGGFLCTQTFLLKKSCNELSVY